MLAYVFWHWKRAGVQSREYESRLHDFHFALRHEPPPGFKSSWSAAVSNAPWANGGDDAYEDWYVVTDSSALDPLNDAAISASRKLPHDQAAHAASGGTAGLYRLRRGEVIVSPQSAQWFSKPGDWTYERLYSELQTIIGSGGDVALWGRQMTLGPALEFCLQSRRPVNLPAELKARAIALRSVFPESA